MVMHYYDSKAYQHAPQAHKALIQAWHKDLKLPFPPASGTVYDDEQRVLTQGSYQIRTKTPPPWVGKIQGVGKVVK